jgi:hypothetical protein
MWSVFFAFEHAVCKEKDPKQFFHQDFFSSDILLAYYLSMRGDEVIKI